MSKDTEKMAAIYERHKSIMYAVAMKILKNPHDAEDAVHNAILPIMRNIDAIKDVDSRDCVYYVTTAVKHISLNMLRDRRPAIPLSDVKYDLEYGESIAEDAAADDACRFIYRAIQSMPGDYRDVLILHLHYGLSTSQIAALLAKSHGTVKSQLTRGKKLLKSRLKEGGYGR